MRQGQKLTAIALAGLLFVNGCYGPFLLTKKVHQWNGAVSDNKWIVEAVFLVCAWLPVYGIATLADAVIFNSVEFWTGNNPMSTADAGTRRIVRGDTEMILSRAGDEMVVQQFQHGAPGPTLRLQRTAAGTIAKNQDGAVLFSAQTLADGSVIVQDGAGQRIAKYSGDEADRFLTSVPQ